MIFIDLDGRKNNGAKKGVHQGQGRKSKAEELSLIEKILKAGGDGAETKLWDKIWSQAHAGSQPHQKMISEYLYGKPKETKDLNISGDFPQPIVNLNGGDKPK